MPVRMRIGDIPALLKVAYAADLPVLLEGSHGIGKSTIFELTARELGIDLVVLDLSLLEPVDLIGVPRVQKNRTVYAPPSILPQSGRGLLLIEELNRAAPATRAPTLELLTRRKLHEYRLPLGWLPCASINPSGGDYDVDSLDPAIRSRFLQVGVEADVEGWLAWARSAGIHPAVTAYVASAPDIFAVSDVTPRSLEYASKLVKSLEAGGVPRGEALDLLRAGWSGLLGENVAIAMLRLMQDERRPLPPDEVLRNYVTLRPLARRMLRDGRTDLLRATLQHLQNVLQRQQTWDEVRQNPSQFANLLTFLSDVPPDLREEFDAWASGRSYQLARRP